MKMLGLISFFLFSFFIGILDAEGDEKRTSDSWRRLNANVQNLYYNFHHVYKGKYSMYVKDHHKFEVEKIGIAFADLVKLGKLKKKEFKVKFYGANEKALKELDLFIEKMGMEYGIFLAREMAGVGSDLYFKNQIKEDEVIVIISRIPLKYAEDFGKVMEGLQLQ